MKVGALTLPLQDRPDHSRVLPGAQLVGAIRGEGGVDLNTLGRSPIEIGGLSAAATQGGAKRRVREWHSTEECQLRVGATLHLSGEIRLTSSSPLFCFLSL